MWGRGCIFRAQGALFWTSALGTVLGCREDMFAKLHPIWEVILNEKFWVFIKFVPFASAVQGHFRSVQLRSVPVLF